jgi:hypothetical protein
MWPHSKRAKADTRSQPPSCNSSVYAWSLNRNRFVSRDSVSDPRGSTYWMSGQLEPLDCGVGPRGGWPKSRDSLGLNSVPLKRLLMASTRYIPLLRPPAATAKTAGKLTLANMKSSIPAIESGLIGDALCHSIIKQRWESHPHPRYCPGGTPWTAHASGWQSGAVLSKANPLWHKIARCLR